MFCVSNHRIDIQKEEFSCFACPILSNFQLNLELELPWV